MRELPCPGCGSTLEVDDRFALFVVCESCDSTLVVDEAAARVHGKMGALAPPAGLLYLGATGDLGGVRFQVIGRVRYGYSRGYWNEWLLALADERACWISEDEDELELEVLGDGSLVGFDYQATQPGQSVTIGASKYRVDEKEVAVCEGGEGQLPFPIVFGEEIPYLEVSGADRFATVEFGPQGPRVFLGRHLEPGEVTLDQTREQAGLGADVVTQAVGAGAERVVLGQGESLKLNCDQCGAPLEVGGDVGDHHECEFCGHTLDLTLERKPCASCQKTLPVRHAGTKSATCPHCGALNDVSGGKTEVLIALTGKNRPHVPLRPGMTGRLYGEEHEVIGHMRLVERDSWGTYTGNEFLLRRADGKSAWLVLEEGHWAYKTEIEKDRPDVDPRGLEEEDTFSWSGKTWEVDDKSEGSSESIDWVEGEFTWVPRVGDKSAYMEAECPPCTVIAEWSATEMEWYTALYMKPQEVAQAFGLKPDALSRPAAKVVAGAPPEVQPPRKRPQLWVSLALGVLCLVVGGVAQGGSTTLASEEIPLADLIPPEHLASAAELIDAEATWVKLRDAHDLVGVEDRQARRLEQQARAKEAAADKYAKEYRRRASMAWSAAARASDAAVLAVGGTPPTTWAPGADGFPAFPVDAMKAKVAEAEAAVTRIMDSLPPVPEPLPESWPTHTLEFTVREGETQGRLALEAPLEGDWVHVQATVLRDGSGGPLTEFSDTLVSTSWSTAVHRSLFFDLPAPGRYQAQVRAATGRNGWRKVAPSRSAGQLAVSVWQGSPGGAVATGGAMFFFLWFGMEVFLRMVRYAFYIFRLAFSFVGEMFS